ncbi:hypothetical protein EON66_10985 [archaeon]|nr:MAG: hypothetical protein EON66_10985 [archaeon]
MYDGRDEAIREMLERPSFESTIRMFDGVAQLGRVMCEAVMPQYEALGAHNRPDVIVFDADTFCAMDMSIRYQIPRVARVGTGPRDIYTTPLYLPPYTSGQSIFMSSGERIMNAFMHAVIRWIITPAILPPLMTQFRGRFGGVTSASHPDAFRPDLPWDGVLTLFNTHWGLEPARSLQPFEHLVGHTTDFELDADKPLPPRVAAWMQESGTPVVYVGLGTLSVLPQSFLTAFARALAGSARFRFIWSVPVAQQANLPAHMREYSAAWTAHAADGKTLPPSIAAGDVLLVPWVPQLSMLMHNRVRVDARAVHPHPHQLCATRALRAPACGSILQCARPELSTSCRLPYF